MLNRVALGTCLVLAAALVAVGVRAARGRGRRHWIGAGFALLLALAFLGAAVLIVRGPGFARGADAGARRPRP